MNNSTLLLSKEAEELYGITMTEKFKPFLDMTLRDLDVSLSEIEAKDYKCFQADKAVPEVIDLRYQHYLKKRIAKLKEIIKHSKKLIVRSDPSTFSTSDTEIESSPSRFSNGTKSPTNLDPIHEIQERRLEIMFKNYKKRTEANMRADKIIADSKIKIHDKILKKEDKIKIFSKNHEEIIKKRQENIHLKNLAKIEKFLNKAQKLDNRDMKMPE